MKTNSCIEQRYTKALDDAKKMLASLDVACGRRPEKLNGLNGWVFEQTVRTCLDEELKEQGITVEIKEQEALEGRVKIDLLIGNKVAVEVKAAGFIDPDEGTRYSNYRKKIEEKEKGWEYLYLTLYETCQPYVKAAKTTFGDDKAFFLDDKKDSWPRFVSKVVCLLKRS